jgi:hypothetical protein
MRSPLRVVCNYSSSIGRRCAVSELAHLPRGLLSLEQWDALELDRTRRWELSEGTPRSEADPAVVRDALYMAVGLHHRAIVLWKKVQRRAVVDR